MDDNMEEIMFAGKIPVTILKFRRDKHDFELGWEREYLDSLIATLKQNMVVFDIGAENGEFAAMVAKIIGGNSMHIFEPSYEYWPNIRKLWIENHLLVPKCFCGYAGSETDFNVYDETFGWPEISKNALFDGTHHSVPIHDKNRTISIDDYCNFTGNYPDVIMIDVEGAELNILNGCKKVIEKCSPMFFISIHNNELLKERSNGSKEDLFRLFDSFNYSKQHIATDHEEHWKFYKQ